ncbi:hypothetical protein DFR38_101268 [Aquitalea magnusonii]|uniref:Uncharacterized protein n=1 Tax=Aquitalea magnusonii TaxID=332411 RepID=A0A318JRS1_9NEIS|nr:hypothetical protein DFR38_101268 [Aquitalea magnusonii]
MAGSACMQASQGRRGGVALPARSRQPGAGMDSILPTPGVADRPRHPFPSMPAMPYTTSAKLPMRSCWQRMRCYWYSVFAAWLAACRVWCLQTTSDCRMHDGQAALPCLQPYVRPDLKQCWASYWQAMHSLLVRWLAVRVMQGQVIVVCLASRAAVIQCNQLRAQAKPPVSKPCLVSLVCKLMCTRRSHPAGWA